MSTDRTAHRQRGISLIELILFIVIISAALGGILLVMNQVTRSSADPLVHKQALAIAEALLEEVELMPFTFCDPDDATAASATAAVIGAAGCTTTIETLGPEGETRYAAPQFDNVSDYHGFNMAAGAILDISGAPIGPLTGYSAAITVANAAVGAVPASESLLITVAVTGPDGVPVQLQGYRMRYSPKSLP